MISVVIPSYNEEDNVSAAAEAISVVLKDEPEYELIFVDDGSKDATWRKITEAAYDSHVRGLRFSRNFGKEAAIRAGLEAAAGDAAVVIDCDLQHPPEVIVEMIKKWRDGAMVVEGRKSSRGRESKAHGMFAGIFNFLMSRAVGADMSGASDFILLDRRALDAVLSYGERGGFFRAIALSVGFETEQVYYEVAKREHGSGKFTLKKLIGYALRNIASYTSAPLYLSVGVGAVSVFAAALLFILKWCGVPLGSYSAGVITLIALGGLILLGLGVIGFYLSRVYDEIRKRPRYIIACDTKERK